MKAKNMKLKKASAVVRNLITVYASPIGDAEDGEPDAIEALESNVGVVNALEYLLNLAAEYQSPETQRLIELGEAVEMALFLHGTFISGVGCRVRCGDELMEWYRGQEADHGPEKNMGV